MSVSENYYKKKYIKYKSKYMKLKKNLYGGTNMIPNNDETMLNFIKKIIEENVIIRFTGKDLFDSLITNIQSVDNIHDFKKDIYKIILTKGYDRLFRLIDYITTDTDFNSKSNNCKALIVAQYIIINQVFGDGNHRTALYVLEEYSGYTNDEKRAIMDITEQIHKWNGRLTDSNLWIGDEANKKPDFSKLYANGDISGLLKKEDS